MQVNVSYDQLDSFTKTFSEKLSPGTIVLLYGDMGGGKTTFVSSLASHFNASSVCSPTFTLVNRYDGSVPINHLDLYRLNSEEDLYSIDIDRYLTDSSAITFIEWPEKLGRLKPDHHIEIRFSYVDEDTRQLAISF